MAKDIYFTPEHEWINFQGAVAYVGVCAFKLIGFKAIHELRFSETGFQKKGDLLAIIRYAEYQIEARMPVDGKVIRFNDELLSGTLDSLVQRPESDGWLAYIAPDQPYERHALLLAPNYQLNGKTKYAK